MLGNALPLLPFHHTVLVKKEWKDDRQEKKGRVIDLEDLRESFGKLEFDESSSEEEYSDSESSYSSWSSSGTEGSEKDPYGDGFDWANHIDHLLPEKAELGKPPPKLYKPPVVVKKKKSIGLVGRAMMAFNQWQEKERERRKHYLYAEYEKKVAEYDAKIREEVRIEVEKHRIDVMKEVTASNKRKKINSMQKRAAKIGDLSEQKEKCDQYDREDRIRKFYVTNLQRWAVEKHDHKIEEEELRRAAILMKEQEQRKREEIRERELAKIEDAKILEMDIEITKKIAEFGRKAGVLAGTNVFDIEADREKKEAKRKKKEAKADFRKRDNNPTLVLRLFKDVNFKEMRKNGIGADGKRMRVFDYPDMTKTRHVTTLRCEEIGERGALTLAADFIRGACPLVETLDLTRCQIQSRGLGRLLHGMKAANLMSLHCLILRQNSITPRGLLYLQESFLAGSFPALVELDIRENEWGDVGMDVIIDMIQRKCFYTVTHLRLQANGVSDVSFSKLVRVLQSTQMERMPYIESINLENNPISGRIKREFSPLPPYISI
jgi:hypothetical protein